MTRLSAAHRPALPPRDGLIVFGWSGVIYSVAPDGGDVKQLTQAEAQTPALSPDGLTIAFCDLAEPTEPRLALMNNDGSDAHELLSAACYPRPSWSPDGTQIVFSAWVEEEDDWQIFIVNADGSGRRMLAAGLAVGPAWSPDGELIAWNGGNLIRPDGGDLHSLQVGGEWPIWSPDGERLVFSLSGHLCRSHRDGTEFEQLSATSAVDEPGAFSPDGSQILFTRVATFGSPLLYVINSDGTNVRRFLAEMEGSYASWALVAPYHRPLTSPRPAVPPARDEFVGVRRPPPPTSPDKPPN